MMDEQMQAAAARLCDEIGRAVGRRLFQVAAVTRINVEADQLRWSAHHDSDAGLGVRGPDGAGFVLGQPALAAQERLDLDERALRAWDKRKATPSAPQVGERRLQVRVDARPGLVYGPGA